MTHKHELPPQADLVFQYLALNPGSTVPQIAMAVFPNHAREGKSAAESNLGTLFRRKIIYRTKTSTSKVYRHYCKPYALQTYAKSVPLPGLTNKKYE